MGRVVLDESISDADLRAAIYRQVLSEEDLAAAVDDADRIMRPLDDDYFDLLADRYSHLRQFAPSLLGAFSFRSSWRSTWASLVSVRRSTSKSTVPRSARCCSGARDLEDLAAHSGVPREGPGLSRRERLAEPVPKPPRLSPREEHAQLRRQLGLDR
jgi:hypothetical protein